MTALEAAYKSLKVLVIDDEEIVRRTICGMLELLGIVSIAQAEDGASGFQEMLRVRPDVVLCDIHMKPVDGQEFLARVRAAKMDWVRELLVIFLSGDNMLDTIRIASQHHADAYMVKPIRLDDLKKQLDIAITRQADRVSRKAS